MTQLTPQTANVTTESAQQVQLVDVRVVTNRLTPKGAQKRMIDECDRIIADGATTWHNWNDVRKQLGI